MSRPLVSVEEVFYKEKFPWLDVDAVLVSAEFDETYNCIAWTVGITCCSIWPGQGTVEDFDLFYGLFGLVPARHGHVVLWEAGADQDYRHRHPTHGSISGHGHGDRWESKTGNLLRIQHGLHELESPVYGWPYRFYAMAVGAEAKALPSSEPAKPLLVPRPLPPFTQEETEKLQHAVATVPHEVVRRFNVRFNAWKRTWFGGALALYSDPHSRASGEYFDQLMGMGRPILPLIVEAMVAPENFFALQLYDAICRDSTEEAPFVVTVAPNDPAVLNGEQGRARASARRWLAANK